MEDIQRNGRNDFERRVRALEALGHRGSATEHEDRAADLLVSELHDLGIKATKEPFAGSDALGSRVLIHIVVAAVGLALSWLSPWVTVAFGLLAAVSFVGEMNTRWSFLSRLLPRRWSRNVVARIPTKEGLEPSHTVIVVAHIDTQRTGMLWSGRLVKPMARLYQLLPGPMKSPTFPVMAAFGAQPILGLGWIVVPDVVALDVVAGALVAVYAVAFVLLLDWARGPFVPGAADNASGAAAALELASRWLEDGKREDVELQIVLTGCEEAGCLGAAAFADAHHEELTTRSCFFLNLDTFGYGAPRFIGVEHTLAAVPLKTPRAMIELCERAADILGLDDAGPHALPTFTDGIAFLTRGLSGVSLLTFEDGVFMPNYHQLGDTSKNMDFDVGWKAVEFAWAVLDLLALESAASPRSLIGSSLS